MKKIMLATIVEIAAVCGFIGYTNVASHQDLNALVLANIEALSRYESPVVVIECSSSDEGRCCAEDFSHSMVMCGEYMYHPCYYTGNINDYCTEPC